jgi:hypothetical protein
MQFGFGSGILYATRTDIADQTPVRFGAFQDLQLDFSGETKELFGQNQFALDVARGKVKIEGKAKFAQISAVVMNAVFFGGTVNTGQTLSIYGEADSVPGSSTYTITVAHSADYVDDLGVYDATTGARFTLVASSPAAGQYAVNTGTGVYTFASADAGKAVLIDYTYTATSGFTMSSGNPLMGNTPRFSCAFTQTYGGNNTTILMPNCVASKYSLPTKLDDYVIEEFDFQAFAPSGGGSPITISTTGAA